MRLGLFGFLFFLISWLIILTNSDRNFVLRRASSEVVGIYFKIINHYFVCTSALHSALPLPSAMPGRCIVATVSPLVTWRLRDWVS